MRSDLAALLPAVQEQFRFTTLRPIRENPLLVETERGQKKIRVWTDTALLRMHKQWRSRVADDRFFIDRMYVTGAGRSSFRFGRFFVTCHDALPDALEVAGEERLWAAFLAYLGHNSRGTLPEYTVQTAVARVQTLFQQIKQEQLRHTNVWDIIQSCYPTVYARAEKADQLRAVCPTRRHRFFLPEHFSRSCCMPLFNTVFFELGQSRPADGCRMLARFFMDEYKACGEQSMKQLFQALQMETDWDHELNHLILAEWYEPDEWLRLAASERNPKMPADVSGFRQIWKQKIELISLFQSVFAGDGGAADAAD